MAAPLDLVFCVDYSSTMALHYQVIKREILNFLVRSRVDHIQTVRIGLVNFRSTTDRVIVVNRGFTDDPNVLRDRLLAEEPDGSARGGDRGVGKPKFFFISLNSHMSGDFLD